MLQIPTIEDALDTAIQTALSQPGQVPNCPSGWVDRARKALDDDNAGAIQSCADEIRLAHNDYAADFDIKGWLYDLRVAERPDNYKRVK